MIKEGFIKKLVLESDLVNDGLETVREMDLSGRGKYVWKAIW